MIAILVCGKDRQEYTLISKDCRKHVARISGEELHMDNIADDEELSVVRAKEQLVHLLYYTFHKGQPLKELTSFRRQYNDAMVMLITDQNVSPLEYLRPGVSPDSLLLHPVNETQLEEVNAEFIESFFERFYQQNKADNFIVKTRDEQVLIPYSHIYYFEARDKKLFVRLKNEEYAFYGTIENLENRLPDGFQRCHRSFIVNMGKIARICMADNYIELNDRLGVPISRSYKTKFKSLRV